MKKVLLAVLGLAGLIAGTAALAAGSMNIGDVASNVTSGFSNVAKLITAASYVAGMAFAVGAVVKFKAHKDNPTQIPIGTPIALLFVGAALIFIPSVFAVAGSTLFGADAEQATVTGLSGFGKKT